MPQKRRRCARLCASSTRRRCKAILLGVSAPRGAGWLARRMVFSEADAALPPLVAFLETAAPFLLKSYGRPAGELLQLQGGVAGVFEGKGRQRIWLPPTSRIWSIVPLAVCCRCRGRHDVHGAGLGFCVIRSSAFGFDATRRTCPPGPRTRPAFVDTRPGPRRRRADAEMALCHQPAAWVI